MAKTQYRMKADKPKREPKLLCKNLFTIGNELREAPVPETMINEEGKTVPFVPKYRESIKGGYKAYKGNTKVLLKASLYFLIFFAAMFVLVAYGYGAIMNHFTIGGANFMGNVGIGYPGEISDMGAIYASQTMAYDYVFYFSLPCILLISIGMAGLFNVAKKIIWNEPIKYVAKPFFTGIAKHWWKYMIFVMLGTAIGLAMGISLTNLLSKIQLGTAVAGDYCGCVFAFVIGAPLLVFPMVAITIIPSYKLSFGSLIKDSFVIAINRFVPYALTGILCALPLGLLFINNIFAIILCALLVAFGFTLWAMLWTGLGHGSYLKCIYLYEYESTKKVNPYEKKNGKAAVTVEGKTDASDKKQNKKPQTYVNPKKKKKTNG